MSEYVQFDLKRRKTPERSFTCSAQCYRGSAPCREQGKLKAASSSCTGRTGRSRCRLAHRHEGDKAPPLDEYLETCDATTLTIRSKDGRTLSPLAILESFSRMVYARGKYAGRDNFLVLPDLAVQISPTRHPRGACPRKDRNRGPGQHETYLTPSSAGMTSPQHKYLWSLSKCMKFDVSLIRINAAIT